MKASFTPDFSLEDACDGPTCGLDEAGRGPLAGPVVAACVYVPEENKGLSFWDHVTDSKKLTARRREALFEEIVKHCVYGIAEVSVEEIDEINILQASLLAMKRAYLMLPSPAPSFALIDGNKAPSLPCVTQTVVKGDSRSFSIAAASILAKVTRDRTMTTLDDKFPHYGWAKNAGYGTKQHRDAIQTHGITAHHRKSFAPVRNYLDAA